MCVEVIFFCMKITCPMELKTVSATASLSLVWNSTKSLSWAGLGYTLMLLSNPIFWIPDIDGMLPWILKNIQSFWIIQLSGAAPLIRYFKLSLSRFKLQVTCKVSPLRMVHIPGGELKVIRGSLHMSPGLPMVWNKLRMLVVHAGWNGAPLNKKPEGHGKLSQHGALQVAP